MPTSDPLTEYEEPVSRAPGRDEQKDSLDAASCADWLAERGGLETSVSRGRFELAEKTPKVAQH